MPSGPPTALPHLLGELSDARRTCLFNENIHGCTQHRDIIELKFKTCGWGFLGCYAGCEQVYCVFLGCLVCKMGIVMSVSDPCHQVEYKIREDFKSQKVWGTVDSPLSANQWSNLQRSQLIFHGLLCSKILKFILL